MSLAGIVQLFCQRGQVVSFFGRRPVDAESGAPRQNGVNNHDGAPVAVQERMSIGEITHYLAGLFRHALYFLPVSERIFYRALNVLGASEENVALADRKVGSGRQAVLSCPAQG
jgi:hypothetical protein